MSIKRRNFVKRAAQGAGAMMIGDAAVSKAPTSPTVLKGKDDRVVRLGIIGVGGMVTNLFRSYLTMSNIQIHAICNISKTALTRALNLVEESGRKRPEGYSNGEYDYRNLINRNYIDAVIIATPWLWHTPKWIETMKACKHVTPEVWGASTVDECWELVKTAEETGMQCMMLENHCFDRTEMSALKMVKASLEKCSITNAAIDMT